MIPFTKEEAELRFQDKSNSYYAVLFYNLITQKYYVCTQPEWEYYYQNMGFEIIKKNF